jgi:hypothetical protein
MSSLDTMTPFIAVSSGYQNPVRSMRLNALIARACRYASAALLAGVAKPAGATDLAHVLSAVLEPATAYGSLLIAVFCMLQRK